MQSTLIPICGNAHECITSRDVNENKMLVLTGKINGLSTSNKRFRLLSNLIIESNLINIGSCSSDV
jgi:GTP cyclohydrolase I